MNHAYLLTGGNLGDRVNNLLQVRQLILEQAGQIKAASALYQTAAWGITDQPDYLNQALYIKTEHKADELLEILLGIEKKLGRIRLQQYGPRLVDIDILFFNDDVIDTPYLSVPHPQIQNRRFVLVPLAEIVPHYQHPILRQSIAQLLTTCPDTLDVKKFSDT